MGSQIALGGKGNRCDGIASTSYFDQGPYKVGNVKLEHTCSICFPKVVGDQLIIRAHIFYPQTLRVARALERGGCEAVGRGGPWPLAVISSGFLVGSDQYRAYAERLASYGYVAVLYDKVENLNSTINDEVSSLFVTEIINWCSASPIFQGNLKTEEVYLIGHSRGGKVSLLAAEADDRVGAVLLLDPVDSNSYAPEGPGYPSAIRQMERLSRRGLPIAIVGGGRSGDCIPQSSNYERFFEGSPSSLTLELSIRDAGHFQFLGGRPSMMQAAVCSAGKIQNETVRDLSRAVMVAWAESMVSGRASSDRKRVGLMNASIGEMKEVLADRGVAQEGAFEFRWKA